jgi:diadenosine tetraphosphate (Ap4A) HIT family hydrolase
MSLDGCPFCNIGATNPPAPFTEPQSGPASPDAGFETTAHMILSTDHVLAFLDIMPLTRGHVLVAPRRHYEMLGDLGVEAGQEVCILRR